MVAESLLVWVICCTCCLALVSPQRVHAFVSDDEVHRVVDYLKEQGEPDYVDGVLEGSL